MLSAVILIGYYGLKADIFDAFENIALYKRVGFFHFGNKFFGLKALGTCLAVGVTGCAGVCEVACALDEVEVIIVTPVFDIILAYKVQRPNEFHAFKITASEFGHHSLDLPAVQHTH